MHVATLEVSTMMPIHLSRTSQIRNNPLLAALQWDKAPTEISAKYSNYADVFSSDLIIKLPENTEMHEHIIELIDGKQPPYELIYALSLIELKTLKTYIKTHLKTGFI